MRPLLLLPSRQRQDIPYLVMPAPKHQKTTTFFDLPAELRNYIYELSGVHISHCDECMVSWEGQTEEHFYDNWYVHFEHKYHTYLWQTTNEYGDFYRPTEEGPRAAEEGLRAVGLVCRQHGRQCEAAGLDQGQQTNPQRDVADVLWLAHVLFHPLRQGH
jgi:hypothetical protein